MNRCVPILLLVSTTMPARASARRNSRPIHSRLAEAISNLIPRPRLTDVDVQGEGHLFRPGQSIR